MLITLISEIVSSWQRGTSRHSGTELKSLWWSRRRVWEWGEGEGNNERCSLEVRCVSFQITACSRCYVSIHDTSLEAWSITTFRATECLGFWSPQRGDHWNVDRMLISDTNQTRKCCFDAWSVSALHCSYQFDLPDLLSRGRRWPWLHVRSLSYP